jgi:hypothetical protein
MKEIENDLKFLYEKARKYVLRYDTGYSLEQVEDSYERIAKTIKLLKEID